MVVDRDDPRLVFMPETDATAANGIVQVFRDHWFLVCPERGVVFWQGTKRRRGQLRGASPQCNSSEAIVGVIQRDMYPWAEVRQIPLFLLPINVSDYA